MRRWRWRHTDATHSHAPIPLQKLLLLLLLLLPVHERHLHARHGTNPRHRTCRPSHRHSCLLLLLLLLLLLYRWETRATTHELRSTRRRRWRRLLLLLLLRRRRRRPRRSPRLLRVCHRLLLDKVRLHVRWQRLKRRHARRDSGRESQMRWPLPLPLPLPLLLLLLLLQLLQLQRTALHDALAPLPLSHVRKRLGPEARACAVPRTEREHNASLVLLLPRARRRPNPGA